MDLVRILHPDEFEHNRQRFKSTAFQPDSDGDISVFDERCALAASGSICSHIDRFYKELIDGEPPQPFYYWRFDSASLPSPHSINQETSVSGDVCHDNISGTAKGPIGKWFKKAHVHVTQAGSFVGVGKCVGIFGMGIPDASHIDAYQAP